VGVTVWAKEGVELGLMVGDFVTALGNALGEPIDMESR